MPESTLKDRLRHARELFEEQLPQKISELETNWNHLRHVQWDSQPLGSMSRIVHKLAGSSATLGYKEFSAHLRVIDADLRLLLKDDSVIDSHAIQEIDGHLTKLKSLLERRHDTHDVEAHLKGLEVGQQSGNDQLIYLVDDDLVIHEIVGTQLADAGYRVKKFEHIVDLYDQLQNESPSLIILDIMFPEGPLAGIEALKNLKVKTGFQVPVIFLSARTDIEARLSALRAGGSGFFSKPAEVNDLLDSCKELIKSGDEKFRTLIVDDDKVTATIHESFLTEANFHVKAVYNPLEVLKEIHTFKPDVLILDIMMPRCNGIELAKILRQEKDYTYLPIVFLTGSDDPEDMRQVREISNCEYLVKPVKMGELSDTVLRQARQYQHFQNKVTELRVNTSTSRFLPRTKFFKLLEELDLSSRREMQNYHLVYLALDELEDLKKRFSLRHLASVNYQLCSVLGMTLKPGHIGTSLSDGVLLVLLNCEIKERKKAAQEICDVLQQYRFEGMGEEITARSSIGFVTLSEHKADLGSFISMAEQAAVQAAKAGGRRVIQYQKPNNVVPLEQKAKVSEDSKAAIDNQSINASSREPELGVDDDIYQAVSQKSYRLKFQPIVNVVDPAFEAYEVLIRLSLENGRELPPSKFLSIVNERKENVEVDRWVYTESIRHLENDQNALINATLFLKVNRESISNKLIVPVISNLMRDARVRGKNRLVFLMRHDDICQDLKSALVFASSLKAIDCGIAVESFDVQESSQYIEALEPDFIKLKPGLAFEATQNSEVKEKLGRFLQSAKDTDIGIIASSIENVSAMQFCYQWGIKYFQGFAIQSPGNELSRSFEFEEQDDS